MRATEFIVENEPVRIKLGGSTDAAKAWIQKVYDLYPQTFQNNHVMPLGGSGDDQQFAMFELVPSFSKRGAVEVKWIQAYPLRHGVGTKAMQELQRLAREDGIALTLFPWDKGQVSQAKLTKFYKGQGFKPATKGSKNMHWQAEESLDEAFTSQVPYTVVRAGTDLFTTRATIGNRDIVFNAQGNEEGSYYEIVWDVDFYEKTPGNMTFGKSGSGNEMQVFSFVIDSLKELISRYQPNTIRFSSHKADNNRSKLYQRMLGKIAPSLGYQLEEVQSGCSDDIFVIKKVTQ